jgi:protein-S-isoprenylcysteine O-methyltransferase Ste14
MSDAYGPGVRVPPPVMVGGLALLGWVMAQMLPVPLGPALPVPGALLAVAGLVLTGWTLLGMLRAGTDPRPFRPDSALLEQGPFRHSRNPIYLGFLLMAAGIALSMGDLWCWLAVAGSFALLHWLVVAKEEAYLAARFGEAYLAYKARVRRWI